MSTTDLIIICATLVVLALLVVAYLRDRDMRAARVDLVSLPTEPLEPILDVIDIAPDVGTRIVIHKLDGQALQGEVVAKDARTIAIDKVDVITEGKSQAAGGTWFIDRTRIDSIQEL